MSTTQQAPTIDTVESSPTTAGHGPVVVGVDRSDTAAAAARRAAELAADTGAPLHLVMAVDRHDSYEIVIGSDRFRIDQQVDGREFLRGFGKRFASLDVTTEVSGESPAKSLVEAAEQTDARMIVVGNRRVQGAGRVLGSIASDVLKRSPCDVLVVHTSAVH